MDKETEVLLREQLKRIDVMLAEAQMSLEKCRLLKSRLEAYLPENEFNGDWFMENGYPAIGLFAKELENGRK